ncbi:Copia protein [Bienertia sinuspersici]
MRAIYLENQFNQLFLKNFPDVTSYCQKLKELNDQLSNVDWEVTKRALVLRLSLGLIDNDPFKLFCVKNGLVFRFSCPHTSPQNGEVERVIRTINNIKRTLLFHASLPPEFWEYALETATYLLNIFPQKLSKT